MSENIDKDIEINDEEFIIVSKKQKDIINELDFNNEEEKIICESIIDNLEHMVSDTIRDMKIAQIPLIGCVRIDPVKRELRNAAVNFHTARKYMTKSEYKEHVKEFVIDIKEKQIAIDKEKLAMIRIRRNNKKKYEDLVKRCGRAYAEMYIKSIRLLAEVPYDDNWEKHYQELNSSKNK